MDMDHLAPTSRDSSLFDEEPMDFDSTDDDTIVLEDDPEAFYVVFPQAETEVKRHALRPLIQTLRELLSQPSQLVAELLPAVDEYGVLAQEVSTLEMKACIYGQKFVKKALGPDQWQNVAEFLTRRQGVEDPWKFSPTTPQVDDMMVKLALYYSHLWDYMSAAVVAQVHRVEATIHALHTEWITVAMPGDVVQTKLPPLEATSMYRPLRLRSQTSALEASNRAQSANPHPREASVSAYRRSRLARQSNEFLIAWFLHHKAKPYPSQLERAQIAEKTGLTEQQVRNWFANMRKRHWKPKDSKKAKKPRCLLDLLLRKNEPTKA